MIDAECHSDDRRAEASFDAAEWFAQASDDAILKLAGIGWRGGYEADAVAEFFDGKTGFDGVGAMFSYLSGRPRMPNGDQVGFECSVDEASAMAWLAANRSDLHARVAEETGYVPVAGGMAP